MVLPWRVFLHLLFRGDFCLSFFTILLHVVADILDHHEQSPFFMHVFCLFCGQASNSAKQFGQDFTYWMAMFSCIGVSKLKRNHSEITRKQSEITLVIVNPA